MIPFLFTSWLALGIAQTEVQAQVQPPMFCLPRQAMVQMLTEGGRQHPVGHGPTIKGDLVELFIDEATGSWTVIGHRHDGISCILLGGRDGWEAIKGQGA